MLKAQKENKYPGKTGEGESSLYAEAGLSVKVMSILKTIKKFEARLDLKTEKFVWSHPFLGFLTIFIGMPLFIVLCVSAGTILITFPAAWLFGWV